MNRQLLKTVVREQQNSRCVTDAIERRLPIAYEQLINTRNIVIISGIRRSGKSTLLQQLRQCHEDNCFYLNFDDERLLDFTVADCQMLMELFIELYGEQSVCYFDEIQNVHGWERFVRRLHDQCYKLFVTGSNATMLSQEMGTHLTGRYLKLELYPFSFYEYAQFKQWPVDPENITTTGIARLNRAVQAYLQQGGFPQYLQEGMVEYLQDLYDNILYRDIIVRYKLHSEHVLKQLAFHFASNVGKCITYNSLSKWLNVGSSNSIAQYCEYLANSYLFFFVKRYHASTKKQTLSPKKVYAIDTGMAHALGFRPSPDEGRLLENMVFVELKRRGYEVYYHHEHQECDFVVCKHHQIKAVIQVCFDLSDQATREREFNGLIEAISCYGLSCGTVITLTDDETLTCQQGRESYQIDVLPIWRWLHHQV